MLKVTYILLRNGEIKIKFMSKVDYTLFVYHNIGKIEIKEVIKIDKSNY